MHRRGERDNFQGWEEMFVQVMKMYKPQDKWTLDVSDDLSLSPRGWYKYDQKQLFARFKCSSCLKEWKSIQVVVHFHIRLVKCWYGQSQGQVKMRIFRQKCHRCTMARYEEPIFSDEAVQKLLRNLVLKILEKCYGESQKSSLFFKPDAEEDVEGPHDRNNCEACEHGICVATSVGPTSLAQSTQWKKFPNILDFLLVLLVIVLVFFASFFQEK